MKNFEELFRKGTGGTCSPFPYQSRLADPSSPLPSLMSVPTGCGKTLAVLMAWLHRRRARPEETPRRLVYCLPMRVLVEQVADECREVLSRLGRLASTPGEEGMVAVHVLQGGEIDRDWDQFPEAEAILVGTQDQLLSRALNRGYAMARARWPMAFGFLHCDALWVFDEIQLMDAGLGTSAQLEGFRRSLPPPLHPSHSLWMSATPTPEGLETPDFRQDAQQLCREPFQLGDEDRRHGQLAQRLDAIKPLFKAEFSLSKEAQKSGAHTRSLADCALEHHGPGRLTLVVCNTVDRAQDLARHLHKETGGEALLLVHSRFRGAERRHLNERISALRRSGPPEGGVILVATQVVEAGVDLDAHTLITECAPWSSLVQRVGRCNRRGGFDDARVIWVPIEGGESDRVHAPYEKDEIEEGARALEELSDVGPKRLSAVTIPARRKLHHTLRRREFLELFDTTPDLAGNDIDISRYIRDGEENDVQIFWRHISTTGEVNGQGSPRPEELCSVAVWKFRDWMGKNHAKLAKDSAPAIWRFDPLNGVWVQPDPGSWIAPGMVFMVSSEVGGYSAFLGWTGEGRGKREDPVPVVEVGQAPPPESLEDDPASHQSRDVTIARHCSDVVEECEALADALALPKELRGVLLHAARWHDAGKAHPVFQKWLLKGVKGSPADSNDRWAKSADRVKERKERPHFRHEAASALAYLQHRGDDLGAYLIMAHHGKVRLSLRSFPGELPPAGSPNLRFARGLHDGDVLPETNLGGGVLLPETTLDLEIMELGESAGGSPSWTARALELRDKHGPFTLAFLEALLRVADWRASARS